jgi:hypothetical protein
MKQEISKLWLLFILLLSFLFIAITSQNIIVFCANNMEVVEYEIVNLKIDEMNYTLTKEEIKSIVSGLYSTPHIYLETDNLSARNNGNSLVVARVIQIKKDLSVQDYAVAYAHELTHVKYQVADETYTTFKTFTTLFESGNAELRHMALRDAQIIIYGGYGRSEYDCGYQILEYLKQNCPEVLY